LTLHKVARFEHWPFSPSTISRRLGGEDDNSVIVWDLEKVLPSVVISHIKDSDGATFGSTLIPTSLHLSLEVRVFVSLENQPVDKKVRPSDCRSGIIKVVKSITVDDSEFMYCGTSTEFDASQFDDKTLQAKLGHLKKK
jgi:hypothetical protein